MVSAGFDLEEVLREAMRRHSARKGCKWTDGWAEVIVHSAEFSALANKLEEGERCDDLDNEMPFESVSRASHYS